MIETWYHKMNLRNLTIMHQLFKLVYHYLIANIFLFLLGKITRFLSDVAPRVRMFYKY